MTDEDETTQGFKTWHDWRPEMEDAIARYDVAAFGSHVINAVSANPVVAHRDGMVIETNENGRSYSCMDQGDMGVVLIKGGIRFGRPDWMAPGIGCIETNRKSYAGGGLCLRPEAGMAWYCGQTSRTQTDKGGTLNKHLHATRSFLDAADLLAPYGYNDYVSLWRACAREGFRKLVKGNDLIKLANFFVYKPGGDPFWKSWIYYGGNPETKNVYFLDNRVKNATYHLFVMRLIYNIGTRLGGSIDWSEFQKKQVGDFSALKGLVRCYQNKLEMGGLTTDSTGAHGQFGPPKNGNADALAPEVIAWFNQWP